VPDDQWKPVSLHIDRVRAGCVVLIEGKHYQVESMTIEESATGQTLGGPGIAGPARLTLRMWRALWIDHPARSETAPAAPADMAEIPAGVLAGDLMVILDGGAYGLNLRKVENVYSMRSPSFGDMDFVHLVLDRMWWLTS
jgi:hypothetical protein